MEEVLDDGGARVTNEKGTHTWTLDADQVRECWPGSRRFADEDDDPVRVNPTEIARILVEETRGGHPFCVCFAKRITTDRLAEQLATVDEAPAELPAKRRRLIAEDLLSCGKDRILMGYATGVRDDNGRIQVVDLEQPVGNRFRLVDPRTTRWILLRGTRYVNSRCASLLY